MPLSLPHHHQGRDASPVGLKQEIARTLSQALAAWRLVYASYHRSGLIPANADEVYTCPQAVSSDAAVILGTIGPLTVTTLTAIVDHGRGLPIDHMFGPELASLRRQGATLMQVGLFADRRQLLARCDEALLDLMRIAFYFGFYNGVTDLVVSVSPEHAPFYNRAFALEYMGVTKCCPALNHVPVVMLRGDLHRKLLCKPLTPALAYFMDHPIDEAFFAGRFDFASEVVDASPLHRFVQMGDDAQAAMRIA